MFSPSFFAQNRAFTLGLPRSIKRANKPGGLGNLSVDAGVIYPTLTGHLHWQCAAFRRGGPAEVVRRLSSMRILAECTELGRSQMSPAG